MHLTLDPASPLPPFAQVRSRILAMIESGELAPGTRLPAVRALAADLDLAANTVARAYKELEEAGFVETRGRAGTIVSAGSDPSPSVRPRRPARSRRRCAAWASRPTPPSTSRGARSATPERRRRAAIDRPAEARREHR